MSARLSWILAALAVGLVLLGALLWRTESRSAPAARSESSARAPDMAAADLHDVDAFLATSPNGSARAPAAVERTPPARTDPAGPGAPEVERLLVRGVVEGRGVDLERVELQLVRVGWTASFPVSAACDADGRFEIDAAELLDATLSRTRSTTLELSISHPDCLRERRRIVLQRSVTPEVSPGTLYVQWRAGTTVCELDVELFLAGFVRGVLAGVEDPLDFAVVAAEFRDGRPVPPWAAYATLDAHGHFELRLPPEASYLVVALAREMRPTALRVDLGAPGTQELVLRPERGAEVSGRLRMAPGFPERELGVELQFALAEGAPEPMPWPRPAGTFDGLVWLDGAFEWRLRSRRTHDGGHFAFSGLAPREYELRALGVGVPGEELRAFPVARLRAPGVGLSFGPVLASLDLDLGPGPDGAQAFELADDEGRSALRLGPYRTDAQGRVQVHLPPGRAYRVWVDGVELGRVATPAAGESARVSLVR